MSASDANDGAEQPRGGAGYWTFAAFAALVIVGSAIPLVRTWLLVLLTLPARIVGWVLPGGDVYTDAIWAARILGWLGWALLAFLWAPLLIIIVGWAIKLVPALNGPGATWSALVRGRRGLPLAVAGGAAAMLPLLIVVGGVAAGLLLPWTISLAALASAALLAPAVQRGEEHPVVTLVRFSANLVDGFCRIIGDGARWASLALVLVVATAVTQRYVFGVTFTKLDELMVYLHAAMFMLMAAATLKADGHVRVDVLYGAAGPFTRALINFVGVYVLLAPMCLVILTRSSSFVDLAWRVGEGSTESDGLPLVFLLKTVIPTFAILLLAQGAALGAREALILVGADEPESEDDAEAHPPHEIL